MTAFLTPITAIEVVDAESFAAYAQQMIGTPMPKGRDIAILRKKLDEFFVANPRADWRSLAALVEWCRTKRKHPALPWSILSNVRWAWSDGALPMLNPVDEPDRRVEFSIDRALAVETDDRWRRMLIGACGLENRREVLGAWTLAHR